jgi:hypothetical protein
MRELACFDRRQTETILNAQPVKHGFHFIPTKASLDMFFPSPLPSWHVVIISPPKT